LFKDKRYWAKTFTQMNLQVDGKISLEGKPITIHSSDPTQRWDANFNDWAGILPHKTFITQSWWFWREGYISNRHKTTYDRMSFYTQHGLQHEDNSRAETDYMFINKKVHRMEPILQWPNTDDYSDYWRMETHTESRFSDSKILATFLPEYMYERNWDALLVREEEKILFGEFDVNEIRFARVEDDRYSRTKAYGFVWQNYYHW